MKSSFEVSVLPYCMPGFRMSAVPADFDGGAEQGGEVEAELGQDHDGHDKRAGDQQAGLDDLHPGGALHAADQHVGDHQRADHDDHQGLAQPVVDAQQQGNQRAGAGHLGQQVEDADGEGGDRRGDAHRALLQAEGKHVRHGELAGVAQQFGDQQQGHQPGDQEADRIQEAVVAVDRDGADDAQERGRREVVAGDGGAVLRSGEGPAAGVVVGRGLVVARGLEDHDQGDGDKEAEDADVDPRVAHLGGLRRRSGPRGKNR